jgi:hypothetical protein
VIIGGMTREELEMNARGFIEHVNKQGVVRLGCLIVFWDRGDKRPISATNVTPLEIQDIVRKVSAEVDKPVIVPGT